MEGIAFIAEKQSIHSSKVDQNFVARSVKGITGIGITGIGRTKLLKEAARYAAKISRLINTGRKVFVQEVVQYEAEQLIELYNLTVQDDNVYYANKILVENCLTFAMPEMPAKITGLPIHSDNNFKSDYDPFDTNRHWSEN